MLMAACSFYVSYPSQFPAEPMMNEQSYIHEELVFDPSQCTPPDTSSGINDFSSERRSSMLQDYFKSANALSRSIMLEKCSVEQQHSKQWTVLSDSKRDEIVDEYFVPNVVREQYEAGLISSRPQWRSGSKQSLDRFHYSSQGHLDEDQYGDQTDGISAMSQPSNLKFTTNGAGKTRGYSSQRSNSAAQILDQTSNNTSSNMQKSKLRSFSIRSKKNGKKQTTKQQNEIIPLFTRDVYELDNDVDLPDDSLLTDHIGVVDDDAFARLKPLRYSFGRKMRNKISHSPDQSSDLASDGYVISNDGVDYLDSSMQDLTQATNSILYNESISTQDLRSLDHGDGSTSVDPTSPVHMMSDDSMSILSTSRPNTRTPDSSLPMRISPHRNKSAKESTAQHPLSRSVRAGSSYMTVTSLFADNRRQMFMKKKYNSTSPSREPTPINSPATSPPPLCVDTPKSHPPLKQYHSAIPIVKTESVNESVITDSTNSSSELPSPLCSPPSSPAGLCPNTGRSKRESGYISSTYAEELSDDEEGSKNKTNVAKRKPRRKLKVERTESFNQ